MPQSTRMRLAAVAAVAAVAAAGAVAATLAGGGGRASRPPFLPPAVVGPPTPVLLTPQTLTPRALTATSTVTRHFEYVVLEREIDVFDIDRGLRRVQRLLVPEAHAVRGVAAAPATHTLYITVGGDGGSYGDGSLVALDLLTNRVLWERSFPSGVDGLSITPDARTLYVPTGERSSGDIVWVVDAATGRVDAEIHSGQSPHNTVVGPGGGRVYIGPRNAPYLYIADTRANAIVRRAGPLRAGVRPFTIDGRGRVAFTTATGFLGLQVTGLGTGKVLYTLGLPGFTYDPATFAPTTPSHGISLAPDNRTLWVLDVPNSYVHEFEVRGLPSRAPRMVASVRLSRAMVGNESPCGEDCARTGWLQQSADGRYLFVGDAGDVIDTRTRRVVAFLPALWNSRYPIEIDWRRGKPVATTTRTSIGAP
jgi:DNA-binding beta-propeller fold protein YncE